MSTQVSLQTLPWMVVKQTLSHIENESLYRYCVTDLVGHGRKELFLPLLSLGNAWRGLVVEHLCKEVRFYIMPEEKDEKCYYPLLPKLQIRSGLRYLKYVKVAKINVDLENICNGFAQEILSKIAASGVVFPVASELEVIVTEADRSFNLNVDVQVAQQNILRFTYYVRQLLPALQDAQVNFQCWSDSTSSAYFLCVSTLVNQLKAATTCLGLGIFVCDVPIGLPPYTVTGLSSLACVWRGNSDLTGVLIRQNAPSLLGLKIKILTNPHASLLQLFKTDDNDIVVYSQLREIRLEAFQSFALGDKPTCAVGVPFPALKRADLKMEYPFGDNVLFRGNSRSLEYIGLIPNTNSLEALARYSAWPSQEFKTLCHLRIRYNSRFTWEDILTSNATSELVYSMGRTARSLVFDDISVAPRLLPVLTTGDNAFANLHTLVMNKDTLALTDVITLLRHLPQLSDLNTMANGLGPELEDVPLVRLSEYAIATCGVLDDSNFKCWKVKRNPQTRVESLVPCALVLSLVCPKFTCVAVEKADRPAYHAEIKAMVASGILGELRSHPQFLPFAGWEEGIIV